MQGLRVNERIPLQPWKGLPNESKGFWVRSHWQKLTHRCPCHRYQYCWVDHDPETSMTRFHESLVKQVMDHQEGLHKRVLEAIERLEKERTQRKEAWRHQETAKYNREAIALANEQAKASTREALILSCMEKITGQSIKLPSKETSFLLQPDISVED
ncbi:trihelix transcription factor DF1 [Fagus crenata]